MVQSFSGCGNVAVNSAATVGSTGRNPASAHSRWACGVYRKSLNAFASSAFSPLVSTAAGFSILKVCGGVTCSTGSPWRSMNSASFS